MSKDRELLIEIMSYIAKGKLKVERLESNEYENIRETKELLAQPQPEQTKQEPEAWMLIDKETGARIPKAYFPEGGVNKDRRELYPLYAASSKREPLSFDDLNNMWCGNPIDFARRIESIHGIGVDNE